MLKCDFVYLKSKVVHQSKRIVTFLAFCTHLLRLTEYRETESKHDTQAPGYKPKMLRYRAKTRTVLEKKQQKP